MTPVDRPPTQRRKERGQRVQPEVLAEVKALWATAGGASGAAPARDLLIEALHALNDALGHLPTPHLAALAQWMRLTPADVFEVASFYHHFKVVHEDANGAVAPPPRLVLRVCDSLPCAMAGSARLLEALQRRLAPELGVHVEAAPCVGRCAQAPVAVVHQRPVLHATVEAVWRCLQDLQDLPADSRPLPEPATPGAVGLPAYLQSGGYALLQACHAGLRSAESLMAELEHAGLRGLGGAGFPAGRKWRVVRGMPGPRQMVVNIDEGEPGTFKDRELLEADPHRFFEGMLVAAWAVQAEAVTIYLRDEYHGARALLRQELAALQAWSPVPLPTMALRRGAGAYICGEESAMIESIEGKRGLPRLRPPYVAEVGLHGQPTLAHNLETLFWVREIVERGAPWFAGHGRRGRQGLRRFCVSGRVREPGVKLAPAGISLHELISEHCGGMAEGHILYAYLPGGASGGILPARLADLPLDFDTLQQAEPTGRAFIGSAAVIVLSQADRATDAARNTMRFFAHESCGQCTPCRAGTAKAATLMQAPRWNLPLLAELSEVMREASICGLGQAAPNVMDGAIHHFPQELEP
jgi:formate dehydrogenase beta subunit